ncbi:dTDP-4-dehydrorhamnose reductase [Shewanella submarina]|uniref:dTDP-4-dehydrorhamnose reductase n=1 Tax=Shewanella submarina TaxID=2016376 RepID=A0ABV7GEZ3_9GAMM|nr:dTDP-4-dehydrorhamnose reductase [Shewanella submarina]MCL1037488.1 dTDP-4-dehydrorhamnose reductase [Shewanella submarina]
MKILVTGCFGQVGRCLVEQLSSVDGVKFIALERDELDITDSNAVTDVVQSFQPDVIINAAAHTAVDRAEEEVELSYAINRDGPENLAKAAEESGAAILHISTDYVFAGDKEGEYIENDETGPQGVYGKSKLAGEIAVANACKRHVIVRTAWVFSEYGINFVKSMLRLAETRDTLGIVSDQIGGPTYAGDIAKVLIEISFAIKQNNHKGFGVYHYSGLPHVSWYQFAKTIFNEANKQGLLNKKMSVTSISTNDYPTPAKRPAKSTLNNKKIHTEFGIEPSDWQLALKNLRRYTS